MDAENETLLWLADAGAVPDAALAGWTDWLDASERERLKRFVRTERRRQFIAGRVMLRLALGTLLGIPPRAVRLLERPGNAPALDIDVHPQPGFSISHSGSWVACAASTGAPLGLDIERIDPSRDLLALADQAFGSAVAARLSQLGSQERVRAFYGMWCRHEAHIKLGCESSRDEYVEMSGLMVVLSSTRPFVAQALKVDLAALVLAA